MPALRNSWLQGGRWFGTTRRGLHNDAWVWVSAHARLESCTLERSEPSTRSAVSPRPRRFPARANRFPAVPLGSRLCRPCHCAAPARATPAARGFAPPSVLPMRKGQPPSWSLPAPGHCAYGVGAPAGRHAVRHRPPGCPPPGRAGPPPAERPTHAAARTKTSRDHGHRRLTPGVAAAGGPALRVPLRRRRALAVHSRGGGRGRPWRSRQQRVGGVDGRPRARPATRAVLQPAHDLHHGSRHAGLAQCRRRARRRDPPWPQASDAERPGRSCLLGGDPQRLALAAPGGAAPRGRSETPRASGARAGGSRPPYSALAPLSAVLECGGGPFGELLLVPHAQLPGPRFCRGRPPRSGGCGGPGRDGARSGGMRSTGSARGRCSCCARSASRPCPLCGSSSHPDFLWPLAVEAAAAGAPGQATGSPRWTSH